MKAKVQFTIELQGDVPDFYFKEWLDWQFGIIKEMSAENPLRETELRDAEIPPFYTFSQSIL